MTSVGSSIGDAAASVGMDFEALHKALIEYWDEVISQDLRDEMNSLPAPRIGTLVPGW